MVKAFSSDRLVELLSVYRLVAIQEKYLQIRPCDGWPRKRPARTFSGYDCSARHLDGTIQDCS
jgi:hypothetical protein